jgi:uncharacterized protein YbjQ (UPF0145 family)
MMTLDQDGIHKHHIDITNLEEIPGKKIKHHYGLVSGSVVRSRNIFADWAAGFKSIIGGELPMYTRLLNTTRNEAIQRMIAQAEFMGANAVTNVRFSTSDVAQGAAEIYVYGTAVFVD